MARPTRDDLPALGENVEDLQRRLRRVSDQLRVFGLGVQADQLDAIHEAMQAPTLAGIVAELDSNNAWVTRALALRMADRLMEASAVISELLEDAEITGSHDAVKRAHAWLDSMGLLVTD